MQTIGSFLCCRLGVTSLPVPSCWPKGCQASAPSEPIVRSGRRGEEGEGVTVGVKGHLSGWLWVRLGGVVHVRVDGWMDGRMLKAEV